MLIMASHEVRFRRIKALNYICQNYPSLHKVPEGSQTWTDWIYEICDKYEISTRTAQEYMRTAKARLKRLDEVKSELLNAPIEEIDTSEKPYA